MVSEGSLNSCRLHIIFLPLMAPGHMIPMIDIAKLFAWRGVRSTVITTAGNAGIVSSAIKGTVGVDIQLVPFPSSIDSHGHENLSCFSSRNDQISLLPSLRHFRPLVEEVLQKLRPDAMVADMFFPWATALCAELGLPMLLFFGTSTFVDCVFASVRHHNFKEATRDGNDSGGGVVVLEGFPHRIELLKTQLPDPSSTPPELAAILEEVWEAENGCYGVLVNSFHELEPDYVWHYKKVLGRRTWHIGPVSLCNHSTDELSVRGAAEWASPTARRCQEWLDAKPASSVLYICFGSLPSNSAAQLREISIVLEFAEHPFLWVVPNDSAEGTPATTLSEAIDSKEAAGDCLIIRGWAPQVLILNHPSIGGFMTHCGWNSSLEGISAGVPMATWPRFADQFYVEKLLVDVLKIGVAVGSKHLTVGDDGPLMSAADIKVAIEELMSNVDEGEARRQRAKELAMMATRAVVEGGSSYEDMGSLIKELEDKKLNEDQVNGEA